MRFRPANISLINRRHYLPRLLLTLSSKRQKQKTPHQFADVDRVTPYQGSTAVYSITFSSPRPKSKDKNPASYRGDSSPKRSPKNAPHNEPDNASTRLNTALTAMHEDTAGEIALLSGGAQVNFTGKPDFDAGLVILASDIWNRYTLGFQPNSQEPGFHTLTIQVKRRRARFDVASRTGYWFDPVSTGK